MKDKHYALIGIGFSMMLVIASIGLFRSMMEQKGVIMAWVVCTGAVMLCGYLIAIQINKRNED